METSVWSYLAVLRKRLWLILLLFAVTMVVILVRAWRTPPAYASSTVLQVMPLESEEVTLFARQNTVSSRTPPPRLSSSSPTWCAARASRSARCLRPASA